MIPITFTLAETAGAGIEKRPSPDLVLDGDPVFTSWERREGAVSTGIWMATPGQHRMIRDGETWEYFHILDGEVEIVDQDGSCQRLGPGDSASIPPHFVGSWRTLKTVRKSYVTIRSSYVKALLE